MGFHGRFSFDLNEPPAGDDDENNNATSFQPQKSVSISNPPTSILFPQPEAFRPMLDNHGFTHASSGSGFQPFVKFRDSQILKDCPTQKAGDSISQHALGATSKTNNAEDNVELPVASNSQSAEREEGEWSDMEGNARSYSSNKQGINAQIAQKQGNIEDDISCSVRTDLSNVHTFIESTNEVEDAFKEEKHHIPVGNESTEKSYCSSNDVPAGGLEEALLVKPEEIKGIEATHASRIANNFGKRPKLDERKEAMLGKKRARQTVLINMEDTKQEAPIRSSTHKRHSSFSGPVVIHKVKEASHASSDLVEWISDRQNQPSAKDQKQSDSNIAGSIPVEMNDRRAESTGDVNSGHISRHKLINSSEYTSEAYPPPIPRQVSWKPSSDSNQFKKPSTSSRKQIGAGLNTKDAKIGNRKHLSKKGSSNDSQFQDISVERLLREVTNEKFWRHPEEAEFQCIPGGFESVDEYVRVFEPLLFEECRAQLHSTYEELTETGARDAHAMVRVRTVEKRERGWYDVVVLPVHECKLTFKEGDAAILSSSRPGAAARSKRGNTSDGTNDDDLEPEVIRQVAGTVRRHIPTDTRDPLGAVLHFYVGNSYDSSSKLDDAHLLKKFQPKSIWSLTVLGTLATTQREYFALHAFRRFNLQMQNAILKPSSEHFPKYEEQPPAMPECFTPNFIDHLHRSFNGPQLSAIQWAAMHTAAGTSGATKRQEPWPFTLVQGPPGTGKTHTVWGMLNVIHLVQYQHYYASLLNKLAPESYNQENQSNSESIGTGSIDEVLQSMDQNLFRTLPRLCPKPRMLVCAPSNAATDELLSRVLDRGFIDGEMKFYRPDVARVGVDTQNRAAQAVSVERRTEQLLLKGREEVIGWMQRLKIRESHYSQQITYHQMKLNAAATAGRSQGSVGVDPDVLVSRDQSRDSLLQNLAAAVEGRDKVLVEMSRLLILESRFRPGSSFNFEAARASLEASFANEAEIVFTTLSSSGRRIFSRLTHGFDMVVIDEAAQASEVALLLPLSLGAARCVLVGDPQQLPATVISKVAGTLLYSRSLFERFQQGGCPTMLLSVQYRMHPQIREFPSRHFYQGRLTDSESSATLPDELYYKDALLQPYIFFDITHGKESHRGGSVSYQNIHEAQFTRRLYEHLQKFLKSVSGKKISVGIITPYKLQLKCLQREFGEILSSEEGKDIYINTVDAFQGQERDVIIMSCVRASNHGVGFVADIRRMNVALTRARRALWVVGNANALMRSDDWAALIMDARSRKCFMDMEGIPQEFFVLNGSNYGRTLAVRGA